MGRVYKEKEVKRLRIADLLRAQFPQNKIAEIVGVSTVTVWSVKKRLEAGDDLKHKIPGPPPHKKLTEAFLDDLEAAYLASPFTSINDMAKIKRVSDWTIREGIKMRNMASYVRPHRPLLTACQKETRLSRCLKL